MKLGDIVTMESITPDNGDHEYHGDFNSPTEVQNTLTDLMSDNEEIEQADLAISQAEKAIEQIDGSIDTINEQDKTGIPLSNTQVQLLEITHESIMTNLGLISGTFPTIESLKQGDRSKQLVATLESEKKGIWAKLITVMKQTIKTVINFILNLTQSKVMLLTYFSYLAVSVKNLKSTSKPGNEEMASSAKAVSVKGKADFSSVNELIDSAVFLLSTSKSISDALDKSNFQFKGDSPNLADVNVRHGSEMALSGGRTLTYNGYSEKNNTPIYEIRNSEEAKVAKVLSPMEIMQSLKMVGIVFKAMSVFNSNINKIKRFSSNVLQFITHMASKAGGVVNEDVAKREAELSQIRMMRKILSDVIGKFPYEAFKNAKVILDYIRNSLKQYPQAGKVEDIPATA